MPGHLVVAYHGCDRTTRNALVAGTLQLHPSRNPYDWLGDGIYFFEGDWRRALKFAMASRDRPRDRLSAKPIRAPAVVGAILRVGHWLDMSTQDGIGEFERTYQRMLESGREVPANKRAGPEDGDVLLRKLDRKVFNQLHVNRDAAGMTPYDAVRGPFPQGDPVAPSSSIHRDTHLQIALRNPACILGYFSPLEAMPFQVRLEVETTRRS